MLALMCLFVGNGNAEEAVEIAASEFKVPTIQAFQISVQGQDLLSVAGSVTDENEMTAFTSHLGSTVSYLSQTPMKTVSIVNQIDINGALEDEEIPWSVSERLEGNVQNFYGSQRGFSVTGGGSWTTTKEGSSDASNELAINVAGGYGRIVDARTVAQAAAISEALSKNATPSDLLRVAEIIGRRPQYVLKHRFEADMRFYADLSEALGGLSPVQLFKLRQVLDSPLYNIGSRRVGWNAGLGTRTTITGFESGELNADDYPFYQYSGFATLLGPKTGLLLSQEYTANGWVAGEDPTDEFKVSLSLNTDHSYSWQSMIDVGLSTNGDEDGLTGGMFTANAQTNLAFENVLIFSAAFGVERSLVDEAPLNWALNSSFTLFIQ